MENQEKTTEAFLQQYGILNDTDITDKGDRIGKRIPEGDIAFHSDVPLESNVNHGQTTTISLNPFTSEKCKESEDDNQPFKLSGKHIQL